MGFQKYSLALGLALVASLFSQIVFAATIFQDISLSSAKDTAQKDGKFLIIDFTASWCGPCHRMEKDTWANADVKKWINDNAIAIQIDVDKNKEDSQAFRIQAMPSVVVFSQKDFSKEFDRQVGYQDSKDILQWFEGIKKGDTKIDTQKHLVDSVAGKGGLLEVEARRDYGHACFEAEKFAEALEQYDWLWQHIATEVPKDGESLRNSMIAQEVAMLCNKNEAAKIRFRALRDESKNNNITDFVVLNAALQESDKSLDWFEKAVKDPAQKEKLKKAATMLERLLIKRGRWADVASLYPDPLTELQARLESSKKSIEMLSHMGVKIPYDPFSVDSARLYACFLAAHKESDAKKIAQECLLVSDTPFMKRLLVLNALEAKQPRKEQLKWVTDDSELKAKLEEALKKPSKTSSKKK